MEWECETLFRGIGNLFFENGSCATVTAVTSSAFFFRIFVLMKAMVITPKSQNEFKFLTGLLKKLNITSATITEVELEDIGLSKMLKTVDKSKKVSKESIMNKLKA